MGAFKMRYSSSLLTAVIALSACVTARAQGPTYQLGSTPSEEEIKARDIAISPDGKELPPGSGTAKEVYAATAYVLYRNEVIKETDVLDARSLPKVKMPNRDNFIPAQPGWKPGEKRPFGYYPANK